ncbi:efflux RND transporter periplasmic adaptor subunit [Planctomycetes bacterium K23_9]|uniref:Putative efflux pump membrane fusion protein n=1 Tax=Stieleria marina TaxID=1930275 RepID=A0A517P1L7_9BACT|nr:putative efflux pump membrane fusion protein [Planctomycetes bacterium K23_9]
MTFSPRFIVPTLALLLGSLVPSGVVLGDDVDKAAKTQATEIQAAKEKIILRVEEAQVSLIQNAFIAAPMAGVVAKVDVSEGDDVQAGSRLVLLKDDQARSELQATKAAYEAARLVGDNDVDKRYAERTLEVRQREYQQSQIANNNFPGTISATELEKLRLVVDQSQLAIEQAAHDLLVARATAAEKQAAVNIAQERLNKHGIETLVPGFVTEVDVEPGEWVEAGKPIVRVISINPIRVECFIDGNDHGAELVGHSVRFVAAAWEDDEAVKGKVTFVSPEMHPVTGQVRLWATIENPDRNLRSGMRGQLEIMAK